MTGILDAPYAHFLTFRSTTCVPSLFSSGCLSFPAFLPLSFHLSPSFPCSFCAALKRHFLSFFRYLSTQSSFFHLLAYFLTRFLSSFISFFLYSFLPNRDASVGLGLSATSLTVLFCSEIQSFGEQSDTDDGGRNDLRNAEFRCIYDTNGSPRVFRWIRASWIFV